MEIKQNVCWQQGIFLQPQHFQLSDVAASARTYRFDAFTEPYFWGVDRIEINESGLKNQFVEFNCIHALFKSGVFIEAPGNAVALKRNFETIWANRERPLTVYLGIRHFQAEAPNVTVVQSASDANSVATRYLTLEQPNEVRDHLFNGPKAHVRTLEYVVSIFFGEEVHDAVDYELIPVCQILQRGEDIVPDPAYIPPCIRISSVDSMLNTIKDLRDDLAARSLQLEIYKLSPNRQGMELDSRQLIYLSALRVLNRYIPILTNYIAMQSIPPWQLHTLLMQMTGELSTFSEEYNVYGETSGDAISPVEFGYQHNDLRQTFRILRRVISKMCDNITFVPHQFIRFELVGDYYQTDIPEDLFDRGFLYYVRAHVSKNELIESLDIGTIIKCGATTHIGGLVERALPGIRVTTMQDLPQGVPRESEGVYCKIDSAGQEWNAVMVSGKMSIFWPNPPEGLVLDFVAVRR